jgi:hypothetical protein
MFVGHLAVALGAKPVAPRVPLAVLVAAAFGLDLLWPVLLLASVETVRIDPGNTAFTPLDFVSYPWSHSLLMSLVWGAAAGAVAAAALKSRRAGLVVGVLVVSHWILDVVSHRPDLPLWPGGPLEGLGLWNSVAGTLVVEGTLFAAGVVLYLRATSARDRQGAWAFWTLMLFVSVVWISGPLSPPPPSVTAIAVTCILLGFVLVPLAIWIERHRVES